MGRAPCCEKVGLKKGRWTAEEDERLIKYIQAHGEGSWRSLPKNAAGACKRKRGRSSGTTIKKPKSGANMAINEVETEETAGEKANLLLSNNISNKGEEIKSLEIGAPKNRGVEGNNINTISSLHRTCMENNNREITEAWGPYEWLDSEIKRLNNELMQREDDVEEASGNNSNHSSIKSKNMEKTSGEKEEEKKTKSSDEGRERSSGCWSSFNADSISGEEWYSTSCGSGFDEQEWLDWDWTAGGGVDEISQNHQWKLWDDDDEGDKLLCWLWDSDNGGEAS
ncbi:hypothetical protein Patl1_24938 [Pistacia atlantica]|uniref:Uncharacterized protein n=1 Tax=Pistacia atlantica TaxID=434234 RepID=A0ACC1B2M8_9ROSI|nr:hypothetical protein Patl1_24938 [Pistacia atlantica]